MARAYSPEGTAGEWIRASLRSMRANFHWVTAISSTKDFSMSSWGIQAAESRSRCWSNLAWSSPGMTVDSARRPWTRALKRTRSLASWLLGPVDFFALRRLARICLIVAIVTFFCRTMPIGGWTRQSATDEHSPAKLAGKSVARFKTIAPDGRTRCSDWIPRWGSGLFGWGYGLRKSCGGV